MNEIKKLYMLNRVCLRKKNMILMKKARRYQSKNVLARFKIKFTRFCVLEKFFFFLLHRRRHVNSWSCKCSYRPCDLSLLRFSKKLSHILTHNIKFTGLTISLEIVGIAPIKSIVQLIIFFKREKKMLQKIK